MIINGTNLSMIRGDSESLVVTLQDSEGKIIPFQEGDTVYFTVKDNVVTPTKRIQKIITQFDSEGRAVIGIEPEDTKKLQFKSYVYDIQLTTASGEVITIIRPSTFTIRGEVTYE